MLYFFFFQAEDGKRDGRVTGVQTCDLPIFQVVAATAVEVSPAATVKPLPKCINGLKILKDDGCQLNGNFIYNNFIGKAAIEEIGRASCRERVESAVVVGVVKRKVVKYVCEG